MKTLLQRGGECWVVMVGHFVIPTLNTSPEVRWRGTAVETAVTSRTSFHTGKRTNAGMRMGADDGALLVTNLQGFLFRAVRERLGWETPWI